jgi:very-short-patch-repair endonuclease
VEEDLAGAEVEGVAPVVHGDVSTEFLKKLYFEEKLSLPQVSKLTNIPVCSIRYRFGKENIKLRSISEGTKLALKRLEVRSKISKTWFKKGLIPWNKGKEHPLVKGNKNSMKRPEVRKKVSETNKIIIPKLYKEHPEILERIRTATKNAMQRPEVKQKTQKTWFKKGQRISKKTEFRKGSIPWNKGKPWPEEFKKKQSIIRKEFIKNNPELLKKSLTFRRPNKTEEKLTSLFQTNFPNEFKFVGNGSFIIEGLNPDWINCNGKKLIIELFGEPWHKKEEVTKRTDTFAKYGFKTLVLWWKETRNEKMLIEKVRNFVESSVSGGW